MKFYIICIKGYSQPDMGIYATITEAMKVLDILAERGKNMEHYYVQEYEGWSTSRRWKHGEKIIY